MLGRRGGGGGRRGEGCGGKEEVGIVVGPFSWSPHPCPEAFSSPCLFQNVSPFFLQAHELCLAHLDCHNQLIGWAPQTTDIHLLAVPEADGSNEQVSAGTRLLGHLSLTTCRCVLTWDVLPGQQPNWIRTHPNPCPTPHFSMTTSLKMLSPDLVML